jgi:hypothetical protein
MNRLYLACRQQPKSGMKSISSTGHHRPVNLALKSKTLVLTLLAGLALSVSSYAAELQLHLGGLRAGAGTETSYSWALEYRRPISDALSASFSWLNEGHPEGLSQDHHRDGQAAQLWWHTAPSVRGLQFEVGLGPYRYFDTVSSPNPEGYVNAHGWGLLGSIGATWYLGNGMLTSLRLNRVQTRASMNTTALVAGLGYQFDAGGGASESRVASQPATAGRMEFDAMPGGSIVNSRSSEVDLAKAISLRYAPGGPVGVSLTYLDEGELDTGGSRVGRRAGLAPQLWLQEDLTRRFSVGVGIGPYFPTKRLRQSDGQDSSGVAALVSVTAAYAITPSWTGRLTWNRVGTSYDRDTDVVLLGLGYRF